MADQGGQPRELVFCHACENEWVREQHGLECPACHSDVVEIIDERHDPRDNNIPTSDNDSDHATMNTNRSDDSLPRHPLHHHNPWRENAPDPDEPDIEHVEWNPAPGVHFSRTSYRSTTPGRAPRGQAEMLGPLFQGFSTIFEGAANAPGRPPGPPTLRQPHPINRPDLASQHPFPDRNHPGPWTSNSPLGGRSVFTATGRWSPGEAPGPFPAARDANNIHAVLGTLLQSMQAGITDQGQGANGGMPNLHTFLSSMLRSGAHGDAVYSDEALDRIISQMMEQHNAHSAPGPASAAAIAALPKQKVDKSMMGQEGKAECSVCMDPVELGDEVTMLPCKHWFHEDCVGAWLKEHDTCPHCRQGIMPKDAPETSDTPRSPDQEPRHSQNPFPFPGPNSPTQPGQPYVVNVPVPRPATSPQATHPTAPMPGAFTQPGMQQPYVPGGFPHYPEPRHFVSPQQHNGQVPSPFPSSQPPPQPQSSQHHSIVRRRRSSARERSSGEGSSNSNSGRGGVTGWFRSLGGGHNNSDRS